jgi:GT2 family glycosyltransferase
MVSSALFRQLGLFDERFFLQLEETDFFHRATQAGYRSLCLATLRVLHKESVSYGAKRAPLKTYYAVRNHLLLTSKHAGRGDKGWGFFLRVLHWQMRTLHREMGGGRGYLRWLCSSEPHAVATRQGAKDFLLRRFGKIHAASARNL